MSRVFVEQIHERLRSALEAKGLTAAQAARDAGEADSQGLRDVLAGRKRLSAELLGALVTGAGIDGGYVLTGRISAADEPTHEERELLALFRAAGLTAKMAAVQALQPGSASPAKTATTQRAKGDNNIQIGTAAGGVRIKNR